MADEEIQESMSQEAEATETEESQQQAAEEQIQEEPKWKKSFGTPEKMYDYAVQKQSEADKYKQQLDQYQKQQAQSGKPQEVEQDILDEFVKDPKGFFTKMMAPVHVQLFKQEFSQKHPDSDGMWGNMVNYVNDNPAILNSPEGMEMVYHHVKAKQDADRSAHAANVKQTEMAETNALKKQGAFVEGSTVSKKEASPIVKPGMSVEEMDKNLDAAGVGWLTDEERNKQE